MIARRPASGGAGDPPTTKRVGAPADLNFVAGDDGSTREDPMVEIRVAITDASQALGLLRRLATLFGRSSVSLDATRNEVRVHSDWESRAVGAVIDAVQSWLAADGVESAEVSVGGRSYTLLGPTLVPQTARAAARTKVTR
jgi:hypothetical protein